MQDMQNQQEFMSKILKAAAEKPEFRKMLIENPKEMIEKMSNFKLPEDFEVAVHEDTPTKLNIVLPVVSDELSEVELSAVAGGVCWTDCSCEDYDIH
jgi:hypothetical protein